MKVWFTSDLHFGHDKILDYEPKRKQLGRTIKEHDEALIKRLNSKVQSDDRLYILGDFGISSSAYIKSILSRLNGHKVLVMGNHDRHSPHHYLNMGFDSVCYEMTLKIAGHFVRLRHHPYRKSWWKTIFPWQYKEKDRHKRPTDRGHILLHGHIHSGGHRDGAWKVYRKMINVGVDVRDYYPIALHEIEQIIQQQIAVTNKRLLEF